MSMSTIFNIFGGLVIALVIGPSPLSPFLFIGERLDQRTSHRERRMRLWVNERCKGFVRVLGYGAGGLDFAVLIMRVNG